MVNNIEVEFECPECKKLTLIFVEVESSSDYYPDTTCGNCGCEIKSGELDDKIYNSVNDFFISRNEYIRDSLYW